MHSERRLFLLALGSVSLAASLAACGGGNAARMPRPAGAVRRVEQPRREDFPTIPFAAWTDEEPEYLLYPGDEIEVATPTAAELTRTLKVGPDGRIAMPLIGPVMAADRTLPELGQAVSAAYASQLVRPVVEVTLRQAGPIRVWVDGEVRTPGVFEMTGDLDAYQAVIQAGGFSPTSRPDRVALIRRGPGGTRMMRVVDLRPRRGEVVALRRGDILFVPRSTLGELAAFFTQVRAALPIGFSYSINGARGNGFAQF
ncbi:polysaccharide biosynthesis/export family protein [Brevundimonas sp. SORGH_AS_0993]|uniref:polysaccharide biosynthesis/export family protein n=1 Tax=Brevundimonas sp. SORGH_AS_0993 TaxID=3041794 RepID=UPI00277DF618|nr:polysaccharide biosynthesis/export family protein [Brevundimonas sp. SORGH_AS_0993]MDQ1153237.1 protein involved in polysaccharide export with SLBB domain [Brevundimonas sp. SORGH_AS_0993]